MIELIGQFAESLRAELALNPADADPASVETPAAKPISGFSLMFKVLWNAVLRLFGKRAA